MKKIIIMMLALAGTGNLLAQQITIEIGNTSISRTDAMFAGAVPAGKSNIRFDFNLSTGNTLMLEFSRLGQVDSLPDLDSLLAVVWKDLQLFGDSLNTPLSNRRIDYLVNRSDKKIRVLEYPQPGGVYQLRNGDITQLKIERDTLRIRLSTQRATSLRGENGVIGESYYVTLLLNHLSDLGNLLGSTRFQPAANLLKKDLANENKKRSSYYFSRYYAVYDLAQQKRTYPAANRPIMNYGKRSVLLFPPYVQVGFQYVNGAWAPSVGAGVEVVKRNGNNQEKHFRLIYEPLFFFTRDASNKLGVDRNGFLTFKYTYYSKLATATREIQFTQNMAVGYLVYRRGEWFDKRSFKIVLPGMQTKSLLLEPEFIFSLSSKNVSPSLKLTYFFW